MFSLRESQGALSDQIIEKSTRLLLESLRILSLKHKSDVRAWLQLTSQTREQHVYGNPYPFLMEQLPSKSRSIKSAFIPDFSTARTIINNILLKAYSIKGKIQNSKNQAYNERNFKYTVVSPESFATQSADINSFYFVKCVIQGGDESWDKIFQQMGKRHILRKLTFRQCFLSQKRLSELCKNVHGLIDLKIGGNRRVKTESVTPFTMSLIVSANPNLQVLGLDQCLIGDQSVIIIAKNLKYLKEIYLRRNNIGDQGAILIAQNLINLKKLGLKNNPINEAGATQIARNLPNLSLLYININRRNYNGILSILISKKKLQTLQLELESSEINRDLTCCIYQISHLDKKAEILTQ